MCPLQRGKPQVTVLPPLLVADMSVLSKLAMVPQPFQARRIGLPVLLLTLLEIEKLRNHRSQAHPQSQDPMVEDRMKPVALNHKEDTLTVVKGVNCHHLGNHIMTPDGTALDNAHLYHHPQYQDPMVKDRMEPVALVHNKEGPVAELEMTNYHHIGAPSRFQEGQCWTMSSSITILSTRTQWTRTKWSQWPSTTRRSL